MLTGLVVVLVFWVCFGFEILRDEIRSGNKKLRGLSRSAALKLMAKAAFYGPFTRQMVVSKL